MFATYLPSKQRKVPSRKGRAASEVWPPRFLLRDASPLLTPPIADGAPPLLNAAGRRATPTGRRDASKEATRAKQK